MIKQYSPHFSTKELACPSTGWIRLQSDFIKSLEELREIYGQPMVLTSACRSDAYNRAIGGHPRSLHLIGNEEHETDTCAVDVAMSDGTKRAKLIGEALSLGFSVGVASNFLHLDWRMHCTLLPLVCYHYKR